MPTRSPKNWRASALSALVVAVAPPLIWYVYLLYPEVAGALCVTVAARVLIDLTPHPPFPAQSAGIFDLNGKGVPPSEMERFHARAASSNQAHSPLPLGKGAGG